MGESEDPMTSTSTISQKGTEAPSKPARIIRKPNRKRKRILREKEKRELDKIARIDAFGDEILRAKAFSYASRKSYRVGRTKFVSSLSEEEKKIVLNGSKEEVDALKVDLINGTSTIGKKRRAKTWYEILELNMKERTRVNNYVNYFRTGLPAISFNTRRRFILAIPPQHLAIIKTDAQWDVPHVGPGPIEQIADHLLSSTKGQGSEKQRDEATVTAFHSNLQQELEREPKEAEKSSSKPADANASKAIRPLSYSTLRLEDFADKVNENRGKGVYLNERSQKLMRNRVIKKLTMAQRKAVVEGTLEDVAKVFSEVVQSGPSRNQR